MDSNVFPEKNQRPIRSYVLRQGRITPRQQRAISAYWPHFGVDLVKGELISFDKIFSRSAPCTLEIGFGMGDSLLAQAKTYPEENFIGIEVHSPGVGYLLANLQEANTKNIRVCCADATDVLQSHIADKSLAKVQIFFPDPWPKKRHHKRRLIQPALIALVAKKLMPGGFLHVATDWEDYAEHILAVLNASTDFINEAKDGAFVPRPQERPLTKFEQRGQKLGHGVWDILFQRKDQ